MQRTSSLGLGYKLCAVIPVAGQRTRRTTFRALKVTSQVATPGAWSQRSMTALLLQTDRHTLHSTPRSTVMSVFVCFCVRCGSCDILYTLCLKKTRQLTSGQNRFSKVLSLACSQGNSAYPAINIFHLTWWHGTVVERRSLTGELSLFCARPAADGWSLM